MAAGKVIYVSPNQGMIVVASDDGFAVVEMLGNEGQIEVGDVLRADWSELGRGDIRRGAEVFDVYFQGAWATAQAAVDSTRAM